MSTPPLLALVTSKTTYTVGTLSVILITVSYYFAFPPLVRKPCTLPNYSHQTPRPQPLYDEYSYKTESLTKFSKKNHIEQGIDNLESSLPASDDLKTELQQQHNQKDISDLFPFLSKFDNYEDYDDSVKLNKPTFLPDNLPTSSSPLANNQNLLVSFNFTWILTKKPMFNIYKNDVLVFLHIQKTAGSRFDQFIRAHVSGAACNCVGFKSCMCNRPNSKNDGEAKTGTWLFSRSSNYGWACGVHADWTLLVGCVPEVFDQQESPNANRRFFYFTMLRDPVQRFISEWLHAKRGATWQRSKYVCNGKSYKPTSCFSGSSWKDVSMDDFLSCGTNLAFNRQTRMLADLSLVNCYDVVELNQPINDDNTISQSNQRANITDIKLKMLESAKNNLLKMASFGIVGRNEDSGRLLSRSLGLQFDEDFFTDDTHSENYDFSPTILERIKQSNSLDLELFKFATQVFEQRLKLMASVDYSSN